MKTAIALWCIVAVGCKQSPVIQQSSGYATMTVFTSEKTLSNNYSASIRGKQDIDIYPQVSGFITKLCVTEGESVKKGQVLFIIARRSGGDHKCDHPAVLADLHGSE